MPAPAPSDLPADTQRFHLVGIGGSGMGALAALLLQMGRTVSGSDQSVAGAAALSQLGAQVTAGHNAANVGEAQVVVRSAAVPDENPEVQAARQRGLPVLKLAEAVGALTAGRPCLAVAGTHGKSTTTALCGWVLDQAGLEPLVLIGAESVNFGGSARAGDGPAVVEADEYDRRFLHLSPEVAIVTSVEADHLDYFHDLGEIDAAFQTFVDRLPAEGRLVACLDDAGAARLTTTAYRETYGFAPAADWRAGGFAAAEGGGSRFRLQHAGRAWDVATLLSGEHNVRNILAALAATEHFGVGLSAALAAVATFQGTRRRFESRGRPDGVWVVDDYAHHPTAVSATLTAARAAGATPVWAVFQPHTTHRTAAGLDEFAAALRGADHALVLPIYRPAGREAAARPVASTDLVERARAAGHPDVRCVESFDEAEAILVQAAQPGSVVLTLGAGDVTLLAGRLVASLAARG